MIRFTRHQRLLQFFRYKRTSAQKTTKETRIALPQNAVEKVPLIFFVHFLLLDQTMAEDAERRNRGGSEHES